jgi:hypothetical protein
VGAVLEKALRQESDPASRLRLCNQIIDLISEQHERAFLRSSNSSLTTRPARKSPKFWHARCVPSRHTARTSQANPAKGTRLTASFTDGQRTWTEQADALDCMVKALQAPEITIQGDCGVPRSAV